MSISQLKALAIEKGVDISKCMEKRELIEAIHAQISGSSGEDSKTKNPITKSAANSENDIQNMTISQLNALAMEKGVDISKCIKKKKKRES